MKSTARTTPEILCASASPRETHLSSRETCVALAALLLCLSAFAERQPFERYQSIVDRQMFGPPPEGFDPTKPPSEAQSSKDARKQEQELTKEQEKLKSAIHFSMINVTPSGETAVGFTDKGDAKNPKNYYLKVGESRDGWTVKEADPVASSMTIVKGEIEVSLTIGGDSAKGAGTTSAASSRANRSSDSHAPGAGLGSLRSRRAQKRAEENARMEAFNKKLQEREAALEKRQQEEQQAREAREAQQAEEREAQRKQLLQIQEELKRAREEKEKAKSENSDSESEKGDE